MSDLPQGWEWTTLGELCSKPQYGWTTSADSNGSGSKLLRITDMVSGVVDWDEVPYCKEEPNDPQKYLLGEGDIVVSRTGSGVGSSALIPPGPRSVFASYLIRIRPSTHVDPKFVKMFLMSPGYWGQISNLSAGSATPNINGAKLGKLYIPLPPLAEQRRIVAALEGHLSRLEAGERALRESKDKLDDYIVSATHEATHGGFGSEVRLADIADVRLGRQRSPKNHRGESMRPYIRAANVGWSGLLLHDVKEMNFTAREAGEYQLRRNDIVLSEASGSAKEVGKPALWQDEIPGCCFQNTLIRVRCHGANPEFIYHYLRAAAASGEFVKHSRGVGIHHIGAARLQSWPVSLPEESVQLTAAKSAIAILEQVNWLDTTLETAERRAAHLRRSLLREAFAGRLVEQDSGDEPASVLLERIRAERESAPKVKRGHKPRAAKAAPAVTAAPDDKAASDDEAPGIAPARPAPPPMGKGTQDALDLGL